jgi:hypothetical protein
MGFLRRRLVELVAFWGVRGFEVRFKILDGYWCIDCSFSGGLEPVLFLRPLRFPCQKHLHREMLQYNAVLAPLLMRLIHVVAHYEDVIKMRYTSNTLTDWSAHHAFIFSPEV